MPHVMKNTYKCSLTALAFLLWAMQAIAFNAACKPGDTACVQGTADWVTIRASLALLSFVAMLGFAYSAIQKPTDKA